MMHSLCYSHCQTMAAKIHLHDHDPLPRPRSALERLIGLQVAKSLAFGKENPVAYEEFSVQRIDFARGKSGRWPSYLAMPYLLAVAGKCWKYRLRNPNEDVVWLCFPGLTGCGRQESFSIIPRRIDLVPKEGVAFVFHGPAAIAGFTPEQCIRATDAVLQTVMQIVDNCPTRKKIRVFCFSAGTHLGFFVANQLGKRFGRPIDQLVAVSPGTSIARGIFATWVAQTLARDLEKRGISCELYDQAIRSYTQRENLEHLPSGEQLVIHAGSADSFIPLDRPSGTDDLVDDLRRLGKNPTYIVHPNKNHISLALEIIIAEKCGRNPHLKQT